MGTVVEAREAWGLVAVVRVVAAQVLVRLEV
jgi:hypothetical protein